MATVLLIGNGGREHAIIDRLGLSSSVSQILVCNHSYFDNPYFIKPGYSKVKNHILEDTSIDSYVDFAKTHKVALVVVGPEKYLVEGITDFLEQHNIKCFGPKFDRSTQDFDLRIKLFVES